MELYLQSPEAFMAFSLITGRDNFTDPHHEMIPVWEKECVWCGAVTADCGCGGGKRTAIGGSYRRVS